MQIPVESNEATVGIEDSTLFTAYKTFINQLLTLRTTHTKMYTLFGFVYCFSPTKNQTSNYVEVLFRWRERSSDATIVAIEIIGSLLTMIDTVWMVDRTCAKLFIFILFLFSFVNWKQQKNLMETNIKIFLESPLKHFITANLLTKSYNSNKHNRNNSGVMKWYL